MTEQPKYFSKARVGNVTAAVMILMTGGLWTYMVIQLLNGTLLIEITEAGDFTISPVVVLITTVLGFMNGVSGFAAKHLWDSSSDTL